MSAAIKIIREVAVKHFTTPQAMKGIRKTRDLFHARIECAYRLRDELDMSASAIGRIMLRDHTTILYYFKNNNQRNAQGKNQIFLVSGWDEANTNSLALAQNKWSGVS